MMYQRTHARSSSRLASSRCVGLGTLVKYASCCSAPRTAALDVMHMPVRKPDSPKSWPRHRGTRKRGRSPVRRTLLDLAFWAPDLGERPEKVEVVGPPDLQGQAAHVLRRLARQLVRVVRSQVDLVGNEVQVVLPAWDGIGRSLKAGQRWLLRRTAFGCGPLPGRQSRSSPAAGQRCSRCRAGCSGWPQ